MLVTYSLTIRRLQQEAAKCYSDPDDHLMMMSQTSDRLRRHQTNSKLRPLPSSTSSRSATLLEVDNKQNHLDWP
jgi:hypothetical protein